MKLRTDYAVYNIEKCPVCEYLVYFSDLITDSDGVLCRFCRDEKRAKRERELARSVEIRLPVVIEWSMMLGERLSEIETEMHNNHFYPLGETKRSIILEAIRADRRTAKVRMSYAGDGR